MREPMTVNYNGDIQRSSHPINHHISQNKHPTSHIRKVISLQHRRQERLIKRGDSHASMSNQSMKSHRCNILRRTARSYRHNSSRD